MKDIDFEGGLDAYSEVFKEHVDGGTDFNLNGLYTDSITPFTVLINLVLEAVEDDLPDVLGDVREFKTYSEYLFNKFEREGELVRDKKVKNILSQSNKEMIGFYNMLVELFNEFIFDDSFIELSTLLVFFDQAMELILSVEDNQQRINDNESAMDKYGSLSINFMRKEIRQKKL